MSLVMKEWCFVINCQYMCCYVHIPAAMAIFHVLKLFYLLVCAITERAEVLGERKRGDFERVRESL